MASASLRSRRPRSDAERRLQAGKALLAAPTARSMSGAVASATSASVLLSCGLVTTIRPPWAASTNSPPMKRRVSICSPGRVSVSVMLKSEFHRVRLEFSRRVLLRQRRVVVLPDDQDRALRRVALVADVGWHRGDVTRLHHHLGARSSGGVVV